MARCNLATQPHAWRRYYLFPAFSSPQNKKNPVLVPHEIFVLLYWKPVKLFNIAFWSTSWHLWKNKWQLYQGSIVLGGLQNGPYSYRWRPFFHAWFKHTWGSSWQPNLLLYKYAHGFSDLVLIWSRVLNYLVSFANWQWCISNLLAFQIVCINAQVIRGENLNRENLQASLGSSNSNSSSRATAAVDRIAIFWLGKTSDTVKAYLSKHILHMVERSLL